MYYISYIKNNLSYYIILYTYVILYMCILRVYNYIYICTCVYIYVCMYVCACSPRVSMQDMATSSEKRTLNSPCSSLKIHCRSNGKAAAAAVAPIWWPGALLSQPSFSCPQPATPVRHCTQPAGNSAVHCQCQSWSGHFRSVFHAQSSFPDRICMSPNIISMTATDINIYQPNQPANLFCLQDGLLRRRAQILGLMSRRTASRHRRHNSRH